MFTIGIYDKSIKLLEINKENKISYAGQLSGKFNSENLFHPNKLSESNMNEIAGLINKELEKSKTKENVSKLLIDTGFCFTNVIPLDISETKEKISSNILWELSNYFPDSYKSYKINYHKLLSDFYTDNIKDTLVIAIKNDLIEAIKKITGLIDIKISSIDIEHFASEKYFRYIRKNLFDGEIILIIGCKKNRFDFSVINDKGCYYYDYFLPEDSVFQDNLVNQYLKIEKIFSGTQLNNIYLYGDETTSSAYKIINETAKNPKLILSNPFYELGITENVETDIISEGYKFVPLCGIGINS